MRYHCGTLFTLAVTVCMLAACNKPEGDIIDENVLETGGGDGLLVPDVDLPGTDTGGDEPEAVLLPTGQCIQIPIDYVYGYTHQCEGSIKLEFDAKGEIGEDYIRFGPGKTNLEYWVDADSYDKPLVAACCGPFDYDNPTSEQKTPYVNSCLFDAVQQICHALPYLLRKQAEESGDPLRKFALNSLANTIENNAKECLQELWGDGPPGPDGSYYFQLNGTTWSPIDDVTFTITETEVNDWTEQGDVTWDECSGMFDNDDAVVPTAPFEVPDVVYGVNASLDSGTVMTGSGPGSSSGAIVASSGSLTIVQTSSGSMQISGMQLQAGSTTVIVGGEPLVITRASTTLREVMVPSLLGSGYVVNAGTAHFVTTVGFEGDSRIVDMVNDAPIEFRYDSGSWEFDPFDLVYAEPGLGTWTLSFDGMTFTPAS